MNLPPMPDHWSNSSLSLYLDCPAAFASKQRGEPSCVPPNVRSGSALAEGLQALLACAPSPVAVRAYAEAFSWDATSQAQLKLFRRLAGLAQPLDAAGK